MGLVQLILGLKTIMTVGAKLARLCQESKQAVNEWYGSSSCGNGSPKSKHEGQKCRQSDYPSETSCCRAFKNNGCRLMIADHF